MPKLLIQELIFSAENWPVFDRNAGRLHVGIRTREGKPQRMSVYPVESQTLTPVPIGNGFTALSPVRA